MVEHRLADRVEVEKANGDGQARVLGEVQVLAYQRRYDHPKRLGEHYQTHDLTIGETLSPGRLGLPLCYGLNAGPYHLGNIGSGIDDQSEEQGGKLRRKGNTSFDLENPAGFSHQLGNIEPQRVPRHQQPTGQGDQNQAGEHPNRLDAGSADPLPVAPPDDDQHYRSGNSGE